MARVKHGRSAVLAGDPDIGTAALAAGERLFKRPWQFLRTVPSLDLLPEADCERCGHKVGKTRSETYHTMRKESNARSI